jgi:hypothetical protein
MAINYTTLLGLAQPVTGTEANTWGTVVNDEITALLDSAIAGAATLDVTAGNVTLTSVDGAADQARMAILIATGTPGTTRNIVAPSQSKTYIVVNQSDASVVLKGSATTGVTIRAGQAATCVWNGADFESVASGDVDGPASATDNAITRYDGTTGKLIQNSGVTIDDSNNVSGVAQLNATTLDATNLEVTNLKAKDGTAAGSIADSTGVVTLASSVLTTTDINGGTVDNTAIGATTASTVRATQVDIIAQGDLRLQDTTGGEFVALQAPGTLASSYTLTLPVDDGTSGQALITDGSGVLSWSSAASGDVYGPASATDNAVARYDGTTGKIIQNSAVTIADDGATVIAANSTTNGLRITQVGTGNALLVEDSANPDATPFVINADGAVIIGSQTAVGDLTVAKSADVSVVAYAAGAVRPRMFFDRANGNLASPTALTTADSGIGEIKFRGFDGTNQIEAAVISVLTDGTPGTNDMPGRLVFSTTADGASSPTERMRIDNAGRVGIGGTASAVAKLQVLGTLPSSGAFTYGISAAGTIPSTTTSGYVGFDSAATTQATAFTLTNYSHFQAFSNLGAGSTVTNQFGFSATSSLTGATNNYGFFSSIASGTGRWNFYANGTADNYFAGNVGIGRLPTSIFQVSKGGTLPTLNGTETGIFQWNGVTGHTSTVAIVAGNAATSQLVFGDAEDIDIGYINYEHPVNAFAFGTNATERLRIASTGTISLGAAPGAESLRVSPVASAVNYVNVFGGVAGAFPYIAPQGSDTNVGLNLTSKGSGAFAFYSNNFGSINFAVTHTASAVNYLQVTGSAGSSPSVSAQGTSANVNVTYATKGTGFHNFTTGGLSTSQFVVSHTASAVNYLQVTGGATGFGATLSTAGSDTNVAMTLATKGTGGYFFFTDTAQQFSITSTASAVNFLRVTGAATGNNVSFSAAGTDANIGIDFSSKGVGSLRFFTDGNRQFSIANTASAVNYLQVTGAATGAAATLSAQGSDTNIDLRLTPKGTGNVRFGTHTATSDVAITGYIEVKDSAGNVRKLAVIT